MTRSRAFLVLLLGVLVTGEARASGEFVYPNEGFVRDIGYFGAPRVGGRTHQGLDIAAPLGNPITAARGGTVTESGWVDPFGYGTLVVIDHGAGYETLYGHMRTLLVSRSGQVAPGSRVGLEGVEGNARFTEPHVHFEIQRWGVPQFIPGAAYQAIRRNSPIPRTFPGLAPIPGAPGKLLAWLARQPAPVRAQADPNARVLGTIHSNQHVISSDATSDGNWLAIDYQGLRGWVFAAAFDRSPAMPVVRVKVGRTPLRSGAGVAIGEVHALEVYPVVRRLSSWYEIEVGDVAHAWLDDSTVWLGSSVDHQLPVLRFGAAGPLVEYLQRRLLAHGVPVGPIDGVFGPATEAAVKRFQWAKGLAVDGIVGPETWQSLS